MSRNCSCRSRFAGSGAPAFAGKLSIVIDDFGYRPQTENQVLALPATISVAVLPNAPHAR
ncbi:divergent polysaccharide deacetylase family protein, partial [Klebsiella pneumoniae]|nr:divergent polysaccharide deacetylase family protein [Klebsiella pneumoniae]